MMNAYLEHLNEAIRKVQSTGSVLSGNPIIQNQTENAPRIIYKFIKASD
jgi:hypothetical protein